MMVDEKTVDHVDDTPQSKVHSESVTDLDKRTSNTYEKSESAAHNTTSSSDDGNISHTPPSTWDKVYSILTYIPPRCRYDPSAAPSFSWPLNFLFAAAGCFTVANLYYSHPILNLLARDFGVTNQQSSYIPTMAQAGYAVGLFLLNPPGDLLRRRPYILTLIFVTATLWIGLCVTTSYQAFLALTFLTGITTVTPQLMLPLVGELAPDNRRATALSVVVAGLLLGLLVARLLSGVVTLYIGWRYIYWISFALQSIIFVLLWLFMPDYPSTNPEPTWLRTAKAYPFILLDTIRLPFIHPVLMQACIIALLTSAPFTSFWTTLTFLLSSPPYDYTSLTIGLFALIGIAAMCVVPLFARLVMEHHVPLFSVILATTFNLVGAILGTVLSPHHVAGPIIQAATTEIGMQSAQVGNRTGTYAVEPKKKNRVNTAYMLGAFGGQLMGTGLGNAVYAKSGWIGSGSANVGFLAGAILVALVRGPHEKGWIGWGGGWEVRNRKLKDNESGRETDGGVSPENVNEIEEARKEERVGKQDQ